MLYEYATFDDAYRYKRWWMATLPVLPGPEKPRSPAKDHSSHVRLVGPADARSPAHARAVHRDVEHAARLSRGTVGHGDLVVAVAIQGGAVDIGIQKGPRRCAAPPPSGTCFNVGGLGFLFGQLGPGKTA